MLEEGGVDGHDVFEVAVLGAVLDHEDFAVALDDLGLDFTHFFVEQDFMGQLAVEDLLTDLGDAFGAEGVGGAGPAEGRLLFLVALEEGLLGPLGGEGGVGADAIQAFEDGPGALGGVDGCFFDVLNGLGHESRSP